MFVKKARLLEAADVLKTVGMGDVSSVFKEMAERNPSCPVVDIVDTFGLIGSAVFSVEDIADELKNMGLSPSEENVTLVLETLSQEQESLTESCIVAGWDKIRSVISRLEEQLEPAQERE